MLQPLRLACRPPHRPRPPHLRLLARQLRLVQLLRRGPRLLPLRCHCQLLGWTRC